MLSLFPELLFLAPLSALVIRVAAALAFGYAATAHVRTQNLSMRAIGIIEGVCAALLFFGGYTQAAAIIGIVLLLIYIFAPAYRTLPLTTNLLLVVLCLSLLVTGAGPFAFDLPL